MQTVAALTSFILLMTVFPAMQTRAQAEIDEVIGKDRLPSSEDEPRLPLVSALIKEVLRFAPVAPLGMCNTLSLIYCIIYCRF